VLSPDELNNLILAPHVARAGYHVSAINEALVELKQLRTFVQGLIEGVCWGYGAFEDLDGGDVQDEAVKLGILVEIAHPQPCEIELCNCEGSDKLYQLAWLAESPRN
jgi:hypothetical protein